VGKSEHCAGWVCLSNSHHSKTRSPWNAVHGLLLLLSSSNSQPCYQCLQAHPTALGGSLSFSFSFFYIFFLPPTPNPLPSGKRALRFASPDFNLHHFFLSLIDMSLFKDRGVAMGKPHCNSSICSGL